MTLETKGHSNQCSDFQRFVPRLEFLTLFRDFWKRMKMCEMNHFSSFCKSYLVLFLKFIIGTSILCCITTDLGIFWYCSTDFWSCFCESPDSNCPGSEDLNTLASARIREFSKKKTPKPTWLCTGISPVWYALQTR